MAQVNRRSSLALALGIAALAFAGCSGSDDEQAGETPNIVQPGAPGEPTRTLSPEDLEKIETPKHTPADVRFMQGMIHHHAQALRMTDLVPARSSDEGLGLLAKRIDISQETEIEQMRSWLKARGEDAPELHRIHGHAHGIGQELMPGMLTETELKQLAAARGTAFARLFLQSMIRHHEGAMQMVAELYAADGGVEPEADAFARHVDADQQIEIARMQTMLAELR
jgi:uncharacterized protein (DUF305 family)